METELLLSNSATEVERVDCQVLEAYGTETAFEKSDEDDDCVICYQTLYRPARTECNHYACESCMLHWALTAMDTKFSGQSAPEVPSNVAIAVDGIKFKCPTCRTYTQANFDIQRNNRLAKLYREEYASRESEMARNSPLKAEDGTELMVLMIGNSHREVAATINPPNGKVAKHEWTFFVKASNPDIIEKVEVILHPSFRDSRLVVLQSQPFSTTHLSQNYFDLFAGVVLKKGWEWVGVDMIVDSDAENGRVRDRFPVKWLLDFNGGGSMRSQMVKIKKVCDVEGNNSDPVMEADSAGKSISDDEDEAHLSSLAAFMSENEIAQLREVRRLKKKAMKEKNALTKSA